MSWGCALWSGKEEEFWIKWWPVPERRGQRSPLLLFYPQCYSSSLMLLHKSTPRCGRKAQTSHQDCRALCSMCRITMGCIKVVFLALEGKMHSSPTPAHRGSCFSLVKKRTTLNPEHPRAATSDLMKRAHSLTCSQHKKSREPRKQTSLFSLPGSLFRASTHFRHLTGKRVPKCYYFFPNKVLHIE